MSPPKHSIGGNGAAADDALDDVEVILRKHLPPRLSTARNHVYVTQKTHIAAQLKRVAKLLACGDYADVFVHGLGAAIPRAISVTMRVCAAHMGSVECSVTTETINVRDDVIPLLDDAASTSVRRRHTSAVHIRLWRPTIPTNVVDK